MKKSANTKRTFSSAIDTLIAEFDARKKAAYTDYLRACGRLKSWQSAEKTGLLEEYQLRFANISDEFRPAMNAIRREFGKDELPL